MRIPLTGLGLVALGLVISMGCVVVTPNAALSDEYRGTLEQRLACTPDVFRLCGEQIPDSNRIVACLRQNTSQLSRSCSAVFDSHASVPDPAAVPRRHVGVPSPNNGQ